MLFVTNLDYSRDISLLQPFARFKYSNKIHVWFSGKCTHWGASTLHINKIDILSSANLFKNATDCIPLIETHPNDFLSNLLDFFGINLLCYQNRSRYCVKCTNSIHVYLIERTIWLTVRLVFLNFYFGICFDFARDFERCTHRAALKINWNCQCMCMCMCGYVNRSIGLASMWGILYELARSHTLCMDDLYIRSNFFFHFKKSKCFF